jgi:hypothetical protein
MGLGKSCSIIALLVHDSDIVDGVTVGVNAAGATSRSVSTTLLIVPPSRKFEIVCCTYLVVY